MSKEDQGMQMFEYNQQNKGNPIGTVIFDSSLPSDINFDANTNKEQMQGTAVDNSFKYVQKKQEDQICSYKVKGNIKFESYPVYKSGSIVHEHVETFEVRAYDEEKSGGLKSFWQSIVGYVKRQVYIGEGYFCIFQSTKEGMMTHGVYKLSELFKVFSDEEQQSIRLIFRQAGENRLRVKNFGVKSCGEIVKKLGEQLEKIGLSLVME